VLPFLPVPILYRPAFECVYTYVPAHKDGEYKDTKISDATPLRTIGGRRNARLVDELCDAHARVVRLGRRLLHVDCKHTGIKRL